MKPSLRTVDTKQSKPERYCVADATAAAVVVVVVVAVVAAEIAEAAVAVVDDTVTDGVDDSSSRCVCSFTFIVSNG